MVTKKRQEYNQIVTARDTARRRALATARRQAAMAFMREVPPVVSSRIRTRLLIALAEYGPITMRDIGLIVSPTTTEVSRHAAVAHLIEMGIVAQDRAKPRADWVFYLNPGHPAYAEIAAFCRALSARWPSPARKPATHDQRAVPMPTDPPCNLFMRSVGTRMLLLVAVSGGISPYHLFDRANMLARASAGTQNGFRRYQAVGIMKREAAATRGNWGKVGGVNQRFLLDPEFFAFAELRAMLWALVATTYRDIEGIARALGRRDPVMASAVEVYERATSHLRVD